MDVNLNDSDSSVYNEKELEYLDKYSPLVNNAFDVIIIYYFIISNYIILNYATIY